MEHFLGRAIFKTPFTRISHQAGESFGRVTTDLRLTRISHKGSIALALPSPSFLAQTIPNPQTASAMSQYTCTLLPDPNPSLLEEARARLRDALKAAFSS